MSRAPKQPNQLTTMSTDATLPPDGTDSGETANNRSGEASVSAIGSAFPLPDYLDDIYLVPAGWLPYDIAAGYEKRPCMIRLVSGREEGPCWPNARKFVALSGGGQWPEAAVVAVAYYRPAEESPNKHICD